MITKTDLLRTVAVGLLLLATLPVAALQTIPSLPGEQISGPLDSPRGLAFDAEGNLLVAVAGTGGEVALSMPWDTDEPSTQAGMTGRIVSIGPEGTETDFIQGLPSYANQTETMGVYRIIPHGDSLWLIFSGLMSANIGAYWADAVVEYDAATLAVKRVINLNGIELAQDPDGKGYDSNVADIGWGPDGTLYIINAGQNDLLSWTADDGLQVIQVWPDNPVPTAIEIAENGDWYISFLGEASAPGAAKIEHWSDGELVETFDGLDTVTDILLDGETLYAVQMLVFGDQGPGPGNVVRVSADGVTPVAEGLLAPFGIAKGPDGALYVTYGTLNFMPDMTGGVVRLDSG